jgi:hypothetical protein
MLLLSARPPTSLQSHANKTRQNKTEIEVRGAEGWVIERSKVKATNPRLETCRLEAKQLFRYLLSKAGCCAMGNAESGLDDLGVTAPSNPPLGVGAGRSPWGQVPSFFFFPGACLYEF